MYVLGPNLRIYITASAMHERIRYDFKVLNRSGCQWGPRALESFSRTPFICVFISAQHGRRISPRLWTHRGGTIDLLKVMSPAFHFIWCWMLVRSVQSDRSCDFTRELQVHVSFAEGHVITWPGVIPRFVHQLHG